MSRGDRQARADRQKTLTRQVRIPEKLHAQVRAIAGMYVSAWVTAAVHDCLVREELLRARLKETQQERAAREALIERLEKVARAVVDEIELSRADRLLIVNALAEQIGKLHKP